MIQSTDQRLLKRQHTTVDQLAGQCFLCINWHWPECHALTHHVTSSMISWHFWVQPTTFEQLLRKSKTSMWGFPGGSVVKNLPAGTGDARDASLISESEGPWRRKTATHSKILAWKIPWKEEPGKLQFLGSQRVGHN